MRFDSIRTPDNWNAQRDLWEYEQRYGESHNLFEEQLDRVSEAEGELERILGRSLAYFGIDSPKSKIQKVLILMRHMLGNVRSEEYRQRFMADLTYCHWLILEHARIMPDYGDMGEQKWLWPIIDLADHLVTAGMQLGESMHCEHDDFPRETGPSSS